MCTSIVYNGNETLIGWNLDILDMKYRVSHENHHVFIEIYDEQNGWLPLFGVNQRGDFVGMPTCWPYDARSNPKEAGQENVLMMDIDLLLENKTFEETKQLAQSGCVCSMPSITYMAQISNREGDVIQVVPGQGTKYLERPKYSVMTNFSPYKGDTEKHPWMGKDRYYIACQMLAKQGDNLDVTKMFGILSAVSQIVCPTVVSMVYEPKNNKVYWCENRKYEEIQTAIL